MRVLVLAILASVSLSGCVHFGEKPCDPIVKHELTYKKIPAELLSVPESIQPPVDAASQKDVAAWIVENEKRTRGLEGQLKKIKEYNDKE